MKKIYISGNYIIADNGAGDLLEFPVNNTFYKYRNSEFIIEETLGGDRIVIPLTDVVNWFDEAGLIAYSFNSLTIFLRGNTSFVITGTGTSGGAGGGASNIANRIIVNQANFLTTLGGVIDSSKVYFIDGIIDVGNTQITIPTTGITIKGDSFDISGLISSADNYTMFISESPVIGSGNFLGGDYYISVNGAGSKVYELYDATGFNAFEFTRINYIDCSNLGDLHNYRQGLEDGTGRFGGSPSLTLHGTWLGGYRITTSIVRSLSGLMTAPIFKEGTSFVMNSRFLTDINCDLPTLAPLLDFSPSNFPNPSTIQIKGAIISRDGAFNANDANILPNLTAGNLPCDFDNNIGIENTFVGGGLNNTAEIETIINTQGTAEALNGTFATFDLQHFDSPNNGELRHIGINPREYNVNFDFIIDGVQNNDYEIFLLRLNGGVGIPDILYNQRRSVDNLLGGRDVAYFNSNTNIILNQNDVIFWEIANLDSAGNCTLEIDSSWNVKER